LRPGRQRDVRPANLRQPATSPEFRRRETTSVCPRKR
jgi:hypothetical protein